MSEVGTAGSEVNGPSGHLTIYILVGIALAIVLALVAPHTATKFEVGGEIFLRLLMMMVEQPPSSDISLKTGSPR